jgi:hypothetical protein
MPISPLSVDWGCEHAEEDIPDTTLRLAVNGLQRKMRAIEAIAILVQGHCVEADAQEDPEQLSPKCLQGLLDAIVELSGEGGSETAEMAVHLKQLARKEAGKKEGGREKK